MKLSLSRLMGSITLLTCLFSPVTIAEETPGTVLITGANRGIGLALAQQFTDAGFRVIGTARNPAGAEDLAATGARVERLDVTDSESVNALASRLADLPIDIVINNAGVGGEDSKNLAELDVDAIMTTLDVNTLGPLRVIKALYPNVVAGQRKVFANISSMMGSNELNTWGCCAGYRASKAALNAINTTLAVDFAGDGMTFVVLHPGYVQTDMNEGRGNITPEQSAEGLLAVISALDAKDNGKYYDWQGKELPW